MSALWQSLARRWRPPPIDPRRWVVIDVEASGLDAHRDRLLAVAGVAVHLAPGERPCIALGDSFEVVLAQGTAAVPDKPNILVHGIGVGAQRAGEPPARALRALRDWVGAAPLLAFHAAFDQTLLERAWRAHGDGAWPRPWLDLAPLAAVLHPSVPAKALDDWLAHFGLACLARHQAAADTLATAELLLRLWPEAQRQVGHRPDFADLQRLAAQQRWLQR